MIDYCRCETPVMDVEHDAGCRRCGLPVDFAPTIAVDDLFDTAFEQGCIAVTEPDSDGNFDGIDSDGELASYHVSMIVGVTGKLVKL